jgi:hypothetical protein
MAVIAHERRSREIRLLRRWRTRENAVTSRASGAGRSASAPYGWTGPLAAPGLVQTFSSSQRAGG